MSFLYNTFKNAPAIGKKIKQVFSKKQPTITGMKSTSGRTDTNQYLLKKAIKDVKTKTEEFKKATGKGDK
tara:strand:+ start:40 stop:249 length:210 start_codon:yes stop_codon:yes gene_type:complete